MFSLPTLSSRLLPRILPRVVSRSLHQTTTISRVISFAPKRLPSIADILTRKASTTASSSSAETVDWAAISKRFGIAAAGALVLTLGLNRDTREGLSLAESSYLHETFMFTGAGLAITGISAKLMHRSAMMSRLMSLNPWVFMGVSLVASIGSMYAVYATTPNSPAHYAAWALFSGLQGITLSPMFFLNPAILSRAGIYTAGALGGLTYVGVTAQNETFLYIGGPLLAGLGVVIVSSMLPMLMPRMAMRTMSILEHVSAYGGVAVFSGLILYDVSKVLRHARMVEAGQMVRDPVRESVSIILDVINLFVKIVQVLLLQQRKK